MFRVPFDIEGEMQTTRKKVITLGGRFALDTGICTTYTNRYIVPGNRGKLQKAVQQQVLSYDIYEILPSFAYNLGAGRNQIA